jgi:SNF2 family DNA or RNA helicase
LNWYRRRNTFLANERGLGKTVQIAVALASLARDAGLRGPFLIIAPVSALQHWRAEFERWSDLNVVVFHGNEASRQIIIEKEMTVVDNQGRVQANLFRPDVVITSHDLIVWVKPVFDTISWRYLVADESHRLKDGLGKRYERLLSFSLEHCSILARTPIPKDISELWALLHFCDPDQSSDITASLAEHKEVNELGQFQAD